jgi:hypothetical protein
LISSAGRWKKHVAMLDAAHISQNPKNPME